MQPFLQEHRAKIELLFLPPYSPELNPQERVWKQTRRKATHNKYFEQEQELRLAVEIQFARWNNPNSELGNLCAFKYVVQYKKTDAEIDELVFKIYGITEKEKRIINESI